MPGVDLKSRLIGYTFFAVAMLILWTFLIFVPQHTLYLKTSYEIIQAEKNLADFEKTVLLLPSFVKTHEALTKKIENLNSSLYTKENILNLFEQFYSIAGKNKMKIVEITPPVEELLRINRINPDSTKLMILNVSIKVNGAYSNFGKFVSSMEEALFFRGSNYCSIISTLKLKSPVLYDFGFRSLLGSLKGES